ncbi:DUF4389 domain-containing protein [Candidatus Woesearchaeota archaeon]|nr:DUF4389 domain-containing protein [Candidatus Woesearchaeota archaeon]
MSERVEALMRIVVSIISGIILGLWKALIQIIALIHWIIAIITGKRMRDLANFCEIWNSQVYIYLRYLTFVSNKRPFPFSSLEKNISEFE